MNRLVLLLLCLQLLALLPNRLSALVCGTVRMLEGYSVCCCGTMLGTRPRGGLVLKWELVSTMTPYAFSTNNRINLTYRVTYSCTTRQRLVNNDM